MALGNILITAIPTPSGVVSSKYRNGDDSAAESPTSPEIGQPNVLNATSVDIPMVAFSTGGTAPLVYELERSETSAVGGFSVVDSDADFSGDGIYSETGLTAETQYWWRLACVDAELRRSGYSLTFTATTSAAGGADVTAPTAPSNLAGTSTIAGQAALTWTNGTDAVGIAFTDIIRGNSVAGVPTNSGVTIATVTGTVSSYTDITAPLGSQVFYKLQHRDAAGNVSVQTANIYVTIASTPVGGTTLLTEDFSSSTWYSKWHNTNTTYPNYSTYTSSPARCTRVTPTYTGEGYVPNPSGSGYALKIQVTQGLLDGTNLSFYPRLGTYGTNPTELFLEYWIRFGSTWNPVINGKLPGLSGDFNDGAKGNAWAADGMNGWSARSGYGYDASKNLPNQIPGSTYFYYVECGDRAGTAYEYSSAADPGQGAGWSNMSYNGSAVMTKNQWRKVKIYAKRNTGTGAAAQRNGALKVWVDDIVRLDFTKIMYTRNPAYQFVERAWMNIYHGGTLPATSNLHVFISDVRVWVP